MKYYGNQMWNAATPSIRKATLLMDEAAFRILQQQLEQYRLNYYAAEKNGKVKMVINYNDSHDIQKLIGKKTASQIHWFPKSRHYVPLLTLLEIPSIKNYLKRVIFEVTQTLFFKLPSN